MTELYAETLAGLQEEAATRIAADTPSDEGVPFVSSSSEVVVCLELEYQAALQRQTMINQQLAKLGLGLEGSLTPAEEALVSWGAAAYALARCFATDCLLTYFSAVGGDDVRFTTLPWSCGPDEKLIFGQKFSGSELASTRRITPFVLAAWEVDPEAIAAFSANYDPLMRPRDGRWDIEFREDDDFSISLAAGSNAVMIDLYRDFDLDEALAGES